MTLPAVRRREAFVEAVSAAIRERRLACGLSQTQLAAILETPRPLVARAESGRHALNLESVFRYAEALGTTPSALFADAERIAEGRASLAS